MKNTRFFVFLAAALLWGIAGAASGQILLTSSTASWVEVRYMGSYPDFVSDEQATSANSDIVGDESNPAFYKQFWNGGTAGLLTDGEFAFRFRMAGSKKDAFGDVAWVGMDLDGNGSIDLFIGAIMTAGNDAGHYIGIFSSGSGANTSPNTTTVGSTAIGGEIAAAGNTLWEPVTTVNDPTVTNLNIDGGTKGGQKNTDHFFSFKLPFQRVVDAAISLGFVGVTENSAFSFIAATATQANSLNQDLNGVDGGVNSSVTWGDLGAVTLSYSAAGSALMPVPEPSGLCGLIFGGCLLALRRHRVAAH